MSSGGRERRQAALGLGKALNLNSKRSGLQVPARRLHLKVDDDRNAPACLSSLVRVRLLRGKGDVGSEGGRGNKKRGAVRPGLQPGRRRGGRDGGWVVGRRGGERSARGPPIRARGGRHRVVVRLDRRLGVLFQQRRRLQAQHGAVARVLRQLDLDGDVISTAQGVPGNCAASFGQVVRQERAELGDFFFGDDGRDGGGQLLGGGEGLGGGKARRCDSALRAEALSTFSAALQGWSESAATAVSPGSKAPPTASSSRMARTTWTAAPRWEGPLWWRCPCQTT